MAVLSRTPNGEIHGQLDAPNKDTAFAMCTKNLHVHIWSWAIGHGELLESGVYFDRDGRRASALPGSLQGPSAAICGPRGLREGP
jgi:hypothetical protein